MLAYLRKPLINVLPTSGKILTQCYSTKATKQLDAMGKSLAQKGFLRPVKPYAAQPDVANRVQQICSTLKISSNSDHKLDNLEMKFAVLEACSKDFSYSVPNSQIHEIKTIGDVLQFYQTSVDTTVPYDAMKQMQLPENLHIQYNYVRFNPESDTKFNGHTAYPKSSTLVTGLKYREKYQGHEAKRSWP